MPLPKLDTEVLEFPGRDARSRAMQSAADNIDSTIFNGDPDPQMRQTLRNMMARWERRLVEWDRFDIETAPHPPTDMCPAEECAECGERDCPHGEPLHYHHDGCPACDFLRIWRAWGRTAMDETHYTWNGTCSRCQKPSNGYTMSWFSTRLVCGECSAAEKLHPKYQEARDAEQAAVLRGDNNFPGIGEPPDL